ncbi:MAG: outer membrane beta-barrel protein [Flavobacteriales bacterium]|nr:outer membrane beta-barrel protein [Flavobacteriales bacterium]
MKIHFLTFTIALIAASTGFAQITPKSYTIGGGFSMGYGESGTNPSNSSQQFNLALSPTIGKFTSEKWLLEGGVGYGLNSFSYSHSSSLSSRSSHSFSLIAGATRFIPITERFYFTLGGYIIPSYTNTIVRSDLNGSIQKDYQSTVSGDLSITPGLTFFINKKWMLYSQFGALKYSVSGQSNTDNISQKVSMNLNSSSYIFGLRYVLGGNK